jgi:hypothetical protein
VSISKRVTSVIVAASILAFAAPARADHDPILGPPGSDAATAKKAIVLSLYGASLASLGASFIFLAQANGADTDAKEAIQAKGGPSDGTCKSVAQCDAARPFRQDQDAAKTRWEVAIGIGGAFAVAATATLLIWQFPNDKRAARVTPAVGPNGGGVNFEAHF